MNVKIMIKLFFLVFLHAPWILCPLKAMSKTMATLPGKFEKVEITQGGKNPLLIALDGQGKIFQLQSDWKTWNNLSFPNKAQSISLGADGVIWATDNTNNIYQYTPNFWKKIPGTIQKIYVGNQNEVYGINNDGFVARAKDPAHVNGLWDNLPEKMSNIAITGDGWLYGIASDMSVKVFNRFTKSWQILIKPADFGLENPVKITARTFLCRALLDYHGEIWQLLPGKKGSQKDEWRKLENIPQCKDISIACDGTIAAINNDSTIMILQPSDDDNKQLEQALGSPLYTSQIVQLFTGGNSNFKKVWTHAGSYYDSNNNNPPPNNHLELLVGVQDPKNDFRDHTASFFSFINPKNPDAHDPLLFGDTIEILSLYAAPGALQKSGRLGRSFKWWAHKPHFGLKNCSDIVVSLVDNPSTKNGSQLFKIVSPYKKTGIVHSQDVIELESLAPENQGKKLWVHEVSRFDGYSEIVINTNVTEDTKNNFFGAPDYGGFQHFRAQAINQIKDFKQCPKTPTALKDDDPLKVTAQDVFYQLSGLFFKEADLTQQTKKVGLESKISAGQALLVAFKNETEYPVSLQSPDIQMIVKKQDTTPTMRLKLFNPLSLKGFSKEAEIDEFGPGQMVKLGAMYSRGFAWINESIKTPGKATLTFLAQAPDQGGIEINLDTHLGTDAQIKIVIGGWNNTKSAILYKKPEDTSYTIIAETEVKNNPLASISPGRFIPYWVSIHNGFIMVGIRQPGESIFLSGVLPEPIPFIYYGFSSENAQINYTEIQTAQPLLPLADEKIYAKSEKSLDLPPGSTIIPLPIPIRVPNEGTISFDAQAAHTVTLSMLNAKNEGYQIIIGAEENQFLTIARNNQPVIKLNTALLQNYRLNPKESNRFWISILGALILVGQGDIGKNVLLAWQDFFPIAELTNIGFIQANHQQKISNITLAPAVTIGTENAEVIYGKHLERFQYRGKITFIRPFEYELAQIERSVKLKNMLTGKLFPVLATPQQTGEYEFRLALDKTGLPSVALTVAAKDSPMKITLEKDAMLNEVNATLVSTVANASASALDATAQTLHQTADAFMTASNAMGPLGLVAMGIGGGISGAAVATQIAAGGIRKAGATKAAKLQAEAQQNRVQAQFAFRSHDSYVLKENVDRTIPDQASVPQTVLKNFESIKEELNDLLKYDFRKSYELRALINRYNDIINRVDHPYIASNDALKKQIIENINKIYAYAPREKTYYEDVINLLLNAMTNAYLINPKIQTDLSTKEEWYNKIIEFGDKLLRFALLKPEHEITIPPLYGSYIWIPGTLSDGKGWISFQAQGQNDLFICFSQDITNVQKKNSALYEIDLGGWNNTKTDIRIQNLGRATASTKDPKALLRTLRGQSYWISFDNGTIEIGSGQKVGEKNILTWKDPYPWQNITAIGVGTWDAPITLSRLKTSAYQKSEQELNDQKQDDTNDEEIDLVILSDEEDKDPAAAQTSVQPSLGQLFPTSGFIAPAPM